MATDIATTRKDGAIRKEQSNRKNALTFTKGIQRYKKNFGNNIEEDLLFVLRLIQISICYS